jgi:hypothetical protein
MRRRNPQFHARVGLWFALCWRVSKLPEATVIREISTEKGDHVSFHIGDVFLPNARELLATWAETTELDGIVVDFSDSGSASRVFAVVEVVLKRTVIVPVERLRRRAPGAQG